MGCSSVDQEINCDYKCACTGSLYTPLPQSTTSAKPTKLHKPTKNKKKTKLSKPSKIVIIVVVIVVVLIILAVLIWYLRKQHKRKAAAGLAAGRKGSETNGEGPVETFRPEPAKSGSS